MVSEQERCEWINVSSGTGSPGKSRKKGHKVVVVTTQSWYCGKIFNKFMHKSALMRTVKYFV